MNILNKIVAIEDCFGNVLFKFTINKDGNIIDMEDCSIADEEIENEKLILRIQKD